MAQLYTTGPVDLWVAPQGQGPFFLGHSEKGPSFQVRPQFSDVFVDLGGQNVPFDVVYQGEDALVTVDLARWNQNVLALIQDIATLGAGGNAPGNDPSGAIGTLMLTEQKAYPLYLRFPYASKAAFSTGPSGAEPPGYRFLFAMLQEDGFPDLGTKARKQHLVWHCLRAFNPSQGIVGQFTLMDFNMTSLGSIN
jgi:hypothetical protein